jgi:hypothetical protein
MNKLQMKDKRENEQSKGPSLYLLYSILFLALAVAIGLALMIVYPFYIRR